MNNRPSFLQRSLTLIVGCLVLLLAACDSPSGPTTTTPTPTSTASALGAILFSYTRTDDGTTPIAVAWSPDNKSAAAALKDTIKIWDIQTHNGIQTLTDTGTTINAIAWSPDSTQLATGDSASHVQIWNVASGKVLHTCSHHQAAVENVAWSPNGISIASSSKDGVEVCDPATGKETTFNSASTTGNGTQDSIPFAWAPDSLRIASGNGSEVDVWSVTAGTVDNQGVRQIGKQDLHPRTQSSGAVTTVSWSPDSRFLASGDKSGAIQVWDAKTNTVKTSYTKHTKQVTSLAWSPDDTHLASGSLDSTVQVWTPDTTTGTTQYTFQGHGGDGAALTLAWSADDQSIVSAGSQKVLVWQAPTPTLEQQLANQLNKDRIKNGLKPYTFNSLLANAARKHSLLIVRTPSCADPDLHQCTSVNEPELGKRITNEGVNVDSEVEAISGDPVQTDENNTWAAAWSAVFKGEQAMILPTDPHHLGLLDPNFTQIGIGIAFDPNSFAYATYDITLTPRSETPDATQLEQQLFAQINADRDKNGLPAYTLNTALSDVARKHSLTMSQGCGTHDDCPGEVHWQQRIKNALGQDGADTEAFAKTYSNPDAWTAVLKIEQGDLSKVTNSAYHQVGIGIVIDSDGAIWLTEDFTSLSASATPTSGTTPTTGNGTPDATQLEQLLFAQINKDRANANPPLAAYTLNMTLSDLARQHSLLMSQGCGAKEQCPGEEDWKQRIRDAGLSPAGSEPLSLSPSPNASDAVLKIEQQDLEDRTSFVLHTDIHQGGIGIFIDSKGTIWLTEYFAF